MTHPEWFVQKVFISYFVLIFSVLHGAGTATCFWKAGYFNAFYQSWYGHGSEDEKQRIIKEIMNRSWYQHETDGYYHRYYGLFLSSKDVYEAQKWFLKKFGWKTIITSHYLTTALLKKYVSF